MLNLQETLIFILVVLLCTLHFSVSFSADMARKSLETDTNRDKCQFIFTRF